MRRTTVLNGPCKGKVIMVLIFLNILEEVTNAAAAGESVNMRCFTPGYTFQPDNKTICVCQSFLVAKCSPISDVSTTTATTSTSSPPVPAISQPLDPLTSQEITDSSTIIKKDPLYTSEQLAFNTVSLKEPPKADLIPFYYAGTNPPKTSYVRRSLSILWSRTTGRVFEAVVNLDLGTLESMTALPEGTKIPLITPDDEEAVAKVVLSNASVIAKCQSLGITDMNLLSLAVWPSGNLKSNPAYAGIQRLLNVWMYTRNFEGDNAYAHPLPFVLVVDGVGPQVIAIENLPTHEAYDNGTDQSGNVVPKGEANYDPRFRPANFLRTDDKPITITSPQGPSYKISGHQVDWQGFRFRLGFNPREGVTLHTITYQANASAPVRPILYRASLTEMGVFYGDPRPPYERKYGFDEADVGMGWTNSLSSPADCLGDVTFINSTVNNNNGDPVVIQNAICIYEDDSGVLWKHTDRSTGRPFGVRSHRLNVLAIVTTGNYDLVVTWSFYQDASIRFNIKLTGLISTNMLALGATPGGFGIMPFPQINGQYHQHLAALRFDADVDGVANTVAMHDVFPVRHPTGSPENPYGNGIQMKETLLKTQGEGATDVNPQTGRVWVVINPNVIHPYTKGPVGWKLVPSNEAMLMLQSDSPILKPDLDYLSHNIWVTHYKEDQLFIGGVYYNGTNVPTSVSSNPEASVDNTDLVLWHVFTPVHIPRAEDFPIMPYEERSVWFKPYNFFMENPSVNVPSVKGFGRDEL